MLIEGQGIKFVQGDTILQTLTFNSVILFGSHFFLILGLYFLYLSYKNKKKYYPKKWKTLTYFDLQKFLNLLNGPTSLVCQLHNIP